MAEKPLHNQYDNIWEIRTQGYRGRGYPPDRWIERIQKLNMKQIQELKKSLEELTKVGRGLIFNHVDDFCRALLFTQIKLPVWKVVIPPLKGTSGAIYYIAENTKNQSYCFRGTYGYAGTGPHESAKIEAILEARGLNLEVRDGDYLLQFFYPQEGS